MDELLKTLKSLPKEDLQIIILELMKSQTISFEDIAQVYVEFLDMFMHYLIDEKRINTTNEDINKHK